MLECNSLRRSLPSAVAWLYGTWLISHVGSLSLFSLSDISKKPIHGLQDEAVAVCPSGLPASSAVPTSDRLLSALLLCALTEAQMWAFQKEITRQNPCYRFAIAQARSFEPWSGHLWHRPGKNTWGWPSRNGTQDVKNNMYTHQPLYLERPCCY